VKLVEAVIYALKKHRANYGEEGKDDAEKVTVASSQLRVMSEEASEGE